MAGRSGDDDQVDSVGTEPPASSVRVSQRPLVHDAVLHGEDDGILRHVDADDPGCVR